MYIINSLNTPHVSQILYKKYRFKIKKVNYTRLFDIYSNEIERRENIVI